MVKIPFWMREKRIKLNPHGQSRADKPLRQERPSYEEPLSVEEEEEMLGPYRLARMEAAQKAQLLKASQLAANLVTDYLGLDEAVRRIMSRYELPQTQELTDVVSAIGESNTRYALAKIPDPNTAISASMISAKYSVHIAEIMDLYAKTKNITGVLMAAKFQKAFRETTPDYGISMSLAYVLWLNLESTLMIGNFQTSSPIEMKVFEDDTLFDRIPRPNDFPTLEEVDEIRDAELRQAYQDGELSHAFIPEYLARFGQSSSRELEKQFPDPAKTVGFVGRIADVVSSIPNINKIGKLDRAGQLLHGTNLMLYQMLDPRIPIEKLEDLGLHLTDKP